MAWIYSTLYRRVNRPLDTPSIYRYIPSVLIASRPRGGLVAATPASTTSVVPSSPVDAPPLDALDVLLDQAEALAPDLPAADRAVLARVRRWAARLRKNPAFASALVSLGPPEQSDAPYTVLVRRVERSRSGFAALTWAALRATGQVARDLAMPEFSSSGRYLQLLDATVRVPSFATAVATRLSAADALGETLRVSLAPAQREAVDPSIAATWVAWQRWREKPTKARRRALARLSGAMRYARGVLVNEAVYQFLYGATGLADKVPWVTMTYFPHALRQLATLLAERHAEPWAVLDATLADALARETRR